MTNEIFSGNTPPTQDPQLTTEALKTLYKLFDKKKHSIDCNNGQCSKYQVQGHGSVKNTNPPQPKLRCRSFTKTFTAHEMQQVLNQLEDNRNSLQTPSCQEMMEFEVVPPQNDLMTQTMKELTTQKNVWIVMRPSTAPAAIAPTNSLASNWANPPVYAHANCQSRPKSNNAESQQQHAVSSSHQTTTGFNISIYYLELDNLLAKFGPVFAALVLITAESWTSNIDLNPSVLSRLLASRLYAQFI
ncbi:hypothetical protein BDB00DRAFT_928397 [Zychaea mexicana]|uniref:uncharacterized protein n=1 Tax=Zychaea mexicana TaxID=64656 RepID=UPI0022FE3B1A|nr:uncharacterized protein BDB00DRAFT_928397 [Zychaea mexicana]KAI9494290.1 hypothetical protein BDB00DRAFT_928397 [Zychaea mexicana]